jgi:hypothetical protein
MKQQTRLRDSSDVTKNEAAARSGDLHAVRLKANSDATMARVTLRRTHKQSN